MSIPKLSRRDLAMLGMMSKDFNENGLSWDEIKEKMSKKRVDEEKFEMFKSAILKANEMRKQQH